MRTIVHISDLHFGREDHLVQDGLLGEIRRLKPSLVVVSGDLTQRALIRQFLMAKQYLANIPFPLLIVPGNHDVPFFDITRRFLLPFSRYKHYIHGETNPRYSDAEIAILGLNTARPLLLQNGAVSLKQLELMENFFAATDPTATRIVVTHHPLMKPPDVKRKRAIADAANVLKAMERCKIDLLLSGHFHHRFSADIRDFHPHIKHSIAVVHAGTAISKRLKEDMNTFNVISISPGEIVVSARGWDGQRFIVLSEHLHPMRRRDTSALAREAALIS